MKEETEETLEWIENKLFIDKLSNAVSGRGGIYGIEEVDYEVWGAKCTDGTQRTPLEYLIVRFRGGGISVRNVTWNSHSAMLRELGLLADGGYYSEVGVYQEMKKHKDWERLI